MCNKQQKLHQEKKANTEWEIFAIHMEIRKYFKLNGSETPKLIDATEIQINKNNPLHSPK